LETIYIKIYFLSFTFLLPLFDRAVGNNSVCKSCAQMDRKLTLETIEKMKQPKTVEHKKKISKSITNWWEDRKQREIEYGVIRQQTTKS